MTHEQTPLRRALVSAVCSRSIAMPNGKLRHQLKISLRAMMLVILVFGLWLGWRVNKAREQREAVAAVQKYGGWVHYDYEFVNGKVASGRNPPAPCWLRKLLGDAFFQEVRQVSLVYDNSRGKRFDNANVSACDDVLARVSRLPGLKVLLLKETQATDKGLEHIGKMSDLERAARSGTPGPSRMRGSRTWHDSRT